MHKKLQIQVACMLNVNEVIATVIASQTAPLHDLHDTAPYTVVYEALVHRSCCVHENPHMAIITHVSKCQLISDLGLWSVISEKKLSSSGKSELTSRSVNSLLKPSDQGNMIPEGGPIPFSSSVSDEL